MKLLPTMTRTWRAALCTLPFFAAPASAGTPSAAPSEVATVHRGMLDGRLVKFVVRDGTAMSEGDIELGAADEVLARMRLQHAGADDLLREASVARAALLRAKSNVYGADTRLWPRNAQRVVEVPYVVLVDPDNRVPAAIAAANQQLAGFMQWVPRTTQADYVGFNLDQDANFGSCSSAVGRVGGLQRINGSRACGTGTLMHEMGHAVGLWHEQQRDDRARWLRINTQNVDPFFVGNYEAPANQRDIGGLDYGSIMHYSAYGFVKRYGPAMDTIPAGIPIGARDRYSTGDIEGMRRLYGMVETAITIDTFPSGQRVVVDGVTVTTPARFEWPLGSAHQLSVPPGTVSVGSALYAFARWSTDIDATLQRTQTVTVNPGDGRLGQPSDRPAVSSYIAYFSSIVAVQTSSNVAGGATTLSPEPEVIEGASGRYWRANTVVNNVATPPPGFQFVRWGPSSGLFHFPQAANRNSNPHVAPVSAGAPLADWVANFTNEAQVFLRAEDGYGSWTGTSMIDRVDTATPAAVSMPENTWTWATGETRRFRAKDDVRGLTANIRSKFLGWSGGTPGATAAEISVTKPAGGIANSATYIARYLRQFKAFTSVDNSLGGCGTVTISPAAPADGFYDFGTSLAAAYTPPAGFQVTRWNGNFAGHPGETQARMTVNDLPDASPEINTIAEVLRVEAVSPATLSRGSDAVFEVAGSGFTPTTEVFVAGLRRPSTTLSNSRIRVTVSATELPNPGKATVTVANRSGGCLAGTATNIDVKAASTGAANYTDLWWSQENGHGVSITQKGNTIFAAWYHHDAQGRPTWVVLPTGVWNSDFTEYTGEVYTPRGSFFAQYDASRYSVGSAVGRVTLRFTGIGAATLSYSIGGISGSKPLMRFAFARSGQTAPGTFGDLWFGGAANNGWGLNISQQGGSLFAAWYTYDRNGAATWFVVPAGDWVGNTYTGRAFRTTGAPVLGVPFNASAVQATDLGEVRMVFSADGQTLALNYNFPSESAAGSYTLTRLAF